MEQDKPRIGWIGTGIMGNPMCGHLMDAGYRLIVFTRTRQKAQNLIERGARWVNSAKFVAEESDIVFTMVSYPQDVRDVVLGRDGVLFSLSGTTIRTNMAFAWAEEGGTEDELLTLSVNPASGEVCRVIIQERLPQAPPAITSLGIDDSTGGQWAGTYGRQGMVIANYYSGAVHGDMGEPSDTPFNYVKMYDYANLPDYVSNYEYLQGGGYEAVPSYGAGPWGDEVALDGVQDPRGADAGLRRPDGSRVSSSVLAHHPKKVGIVFWMRDKRPRVLSVYGVENTMSGRPLTVTVEQIDDRGRNTGEPA